MRFEVASAQTFNGGPYDLVTTFDCLHDMGDPLGAARHIREMLAPDGTWMVVEPYAGHSVTDNLNPVGRVYYSFSTFLCVPNALSQDGGYSLGAQAGEEPIGGSPPTPATPVSAGWPRRPSTSSTRSARSRRTSRPAAPAGIRPPACRCGPGTGWRRAATGPGTRGGEPGPPARGRGPDRRAAG